MFKQRPSSFVSLHRRTIVLIFKQRPSRFLPLHCRTIVQIFRLDSKMDRALIVCPLNVFFFSLADGSFVSLHRRTIVLILKTETISFPYVALAYNRTNV